MAHAWPLDSTDGTTPTYTGRALRLAQVSPFLSGATADRPFGARSGVRPGTSPHTVTVSGSTWTVHPCAGVIDPHLSAAAGPYSWAVAEPESGTIPSASQVYTRWDGIWLVLDDPAESEGETAPSARIEYRAGQASATPTMPTAPERSMVLAQVVVPPAGSGEPSAVWTAPQMSAAGAPIRVRSTAEATALLATMGASNESPLWVEHIGETNALSGRLWRHDGTGWQTLAPAVAPVIATFDNGKIATGAVAGTVVIPAVPFPTVNVISVLATGGFDTGARKVQIALSVSAGTLSGRNLFPVSAPAAGWATFAAQQRLVLPANMACTVTLKSASDGPSYHIGSVAVHRTLN
ncbi:hypothetical protein [Cellulomonas sp. NPDC089187]|uniref:hypothetical protein n=1 Tax=Cellulomonas sp. NPDC089187 TaxID=3154970 RepID=UPI003420B447